MAQFPILWVATTNPVFLAIQAFHRVSAKLEFEAQLEGNHPWAAVAAESHS